MAIRSVWLVALGMTLALWACNQRSTKKLSLSRKDTLAVLQTALNDPFLFRDVCLYMPEDILTLKQSKIVKPDYQLTFNQRPANIVTIKEDGLDVRGAYPGQLMIGFPLFKSSHKDTVTLSMIIYTGNTGVLYKMARNDNGFWEIQSSEIGKF